MIREMFIVAAGSAVGGVLRFLCGRLAGRIIEHPFPWATFTVNVLGSMLIGYLLAGQLKQVNQDWVLFLTVGFCGGFTTFSAFSFENILLIRHGQIFMATVYIIASVSTGLLATWLGYSLGK